MTGHGFGVTGDPADLPPGARAVAINIGPAVEAAGRAIHEEIRRDGDAPWEDLPKLLQHHYMELGLAVVHALVEQGWHSVDMHAAIKAAIEEESTPPPSGLDPR